MATTSQLLTWAETQNHGWVREGAKGSRALLNEAHKLLLYNELEQRIAVDTTTGDYPYITTVDNTVLYNLPANCSILKALLIDFTETRDDYPWTYEDFESRGRRYYKVLNINTREATPAAPLAGFVFVGVNPGATTAKFRIFYYEAPINITSDAVQHQMPGSADMEFLLPATIKLIEGMDHGNIIEARQYITEVMKPAFIKTLSRGAQGTPTYCRKRAF